MERFANETVVITGGAGQNIGSTVAQRFADEGARVGILDINVENAQEVCSEIESSGGDAMFVRTDLTKVSATQDAIDTIADEYGSIDILVTNAGAAFGTTLDSIDEKTFYQDIDLNLKSVFFATKAALPYLRDVGGSVVFVSSINALLGGFSEVAYGSAKAGLHSLARGLTADYASEGVRFNVVAAGSVIDDSAIWRKREEESPGLLDRIGGLYPMGRYGKPEDITGAILFLVSEDASWISGTVLPVDGGLTATGAVEGGRWWKEL